MVTLGDEGGDGRVRGRATLTTGGKGVKKGGELAMATWAARGGGKKK